MPANQITRAYAAHHARLAPARAALSRAGICEEFCHRHPDDAHIVLIIGETQLPTGEMSVRPSGAIDPIGLPGLLFMSDATLIETVTAWSWATEDIEHPTAADAQALWQALVTAALAAAGAHYPERGTACPCVRCRWEVARLERQRSPKERGEWPVYRGGVQ